MKGWKNFRSRARCLFAAIALAGALLPGHSSAQARREIRIGSSVIGFSSLMTYFARDYQFFEKENLDAKIIYAQTNVVLAALAAGNFDYTNLATSAVEATLRGMPLRLITVTNAEPLWGIVVRDNVTQIADLKGKKLGVSSFGGTSYSAALYVLKHFGLRPKEDVVILATGGTTERIAALKHGSVDAAIIPAPGDMKARQEGFAILLDAGSVYKLPNGGMSTTVAKIRENPDEVRRVVRALVQATKFFVEPRNKSEIMRYLGRVFKLDPASTEEFYQRFVPTLSPTGMVELDKIKLIVDGALDRGLITKPVGPESLVDFSFARGL
ncbi:MAG TPA: ABC transporter substrate-binding protein [Candidatus Eisenbacteria bacterium]|nr:ABC transporter substrate-binding protein [Candidatus Eisenbacteria bacterium]